jgi:hypothetical protein
MPAPFVGLPDLLHVDRLLVTEDPALADAPGFLGDVDHLRVVGVGEGRSDVARVVVGCARIAATHEQESQYG